MTVSVLTNQSIVGGDSSVNYAFNYGTQLGIGSAPNSGAGSTIGMGFLVNQSAGTLQGISSSVAASTGFTGVSGNFKIEFDSWMNYNGPLGPTAPIGGNGSTQLASAGWGSDGTSAEWSGTSTKGIVFAATGDGGATPDYQVVRNGAVQAVGTGVYTAGTAANSNNSSNAYYAPFGGKAAPADQITKYSQQTGTTQAGAYGMAWRNVVIEKSANSLTWTVDGLKLATVDVTSATTLSGNNISFGMYDLNAGSSTDPNDLLSTAIFDNIRVTQVVATPEPATWAMMGMGVLALAMMGLHRKRREGETASSSSGLSL
jgi:hypothetical protein